MRIYTNPVEKKVAIGLIGYESKREIARCLDGWVGHIDTMILGDGKFDFYDAPNDYSEDGWLEFAEKRYGDKCEVVTYKYAGKQSEKRQKYLDIAGELKCDFLITVDTEEYIHPDYQDWDSFYRRLYHFSEATEDRLFYQWIWIPSQKLWPRQGNNFPSNTWRRSMKIHKDPGTMRYCMGNHFAWCAKNVSDNKLIKWQLNNPERNKIQGNPYLYQAQTVIDGVRVTMDRTLRTKEQNKKSTHWGFQNMHEEQATILFKQYDIEKKIPPPEGFKSWVEFGKQPHKFNEFGVMQPLE